jgi:MurNAc alpha-1-phosphate uridylyltransferase
MRAMILAAGRGNRMRPLSDLRPKPLLLINKKPLIVYHIEALAKALITEIVINLGYLGEQLEATLGNGHALGVDIQYSYEDPILETAGGIKKALPLLGERFIALSADIYTHFDFEVLKKYAAIEKNASRAHLILTPNPVYNLKGDFGFVGQTDFLSTKAPVLYNFGNIGLYHAAFFDECPEGIYPLGKWFEHGIVNKQITGELYLGLWHNIGTPLQLTELNNRTESMLD